MIIIFSFEKYSLVKTKVSLKNNKVRDTSWLVGCSINGKTRWGHRHFSLVPSQLVFSTKIQLPFKWCSWGMICCWKITSVAWRAQGKFLNCVCVFLCNFLWTIFHSNFWQTPHRGKDSKCLQPMKIASEVWVLSSLKSHPSSPSFLQLLGHTGE